MSSRWPHLLYQMYVELKYVRYKSQDKFDNDKRDVWLSERQLIGHGNKIMNVLRGNVMCVDTEFGNCMDVFM